MNHAVTTRGPERIPARRYVPGSGWEAKLPRLMSWLCYVNAALCLVTALVPSLRDDFKWAQVLLEFAFAPPNFAWAVMLIILGAALAKRKRAAWTLLLVAEILEVALIVVALVFLAGTGVTIVAQLAVDLVVIVALVRSRSEFFATVQKGNGARALMTFIAGLAASLLIGSLILAMSGESSSGVSRIMSVVGQFAESVGIESQFGITTVVPRPFALMVGVLGSLTFIATAIAFYRPRRKDLLITPIDEVRIRSLLLDFGADDSLGYFGTRRDRSAMFDPTRRAVITYRVLMGTSLACGDPIGDPNQWPAAIEAWLEEARHFGWTPAVGGSSRRGAKAFEAAGFNSRELGDEAVIDFHDFQLSGRQMRAVRQAVHRIRRSGCTVTVDRQSDLTERELDTAVDAADQWRTTRSERGFSMALGRLGDACDSDCALVRAFDRDGRLLGVLSLSPWGATGLSLDLMRRAPQSDNGLIEYMVSALVDAGPALGVDHMSLNFAVMRGVIEEGERLGAGPISRFTRNAIMVASRWWQIDSLYRSNDKYDPMWVRRYLQFINAGDLPRVALAFAAAEGLIPVWPGWRGIRALRNQPSPLRSACAGSPIELWREEQARRQAELVRLSAVACADPFSGFPEQEQVRRRKLALMRDRGLDPYATSFEPSTAVAELRADYGNLGSDQRTGEVVSVAGRIMLNRVSGKICFASIRDWSGDLQVMLTANETGVDLLASWKELVDLGDLVGVTGEVITSKRGELSVLVNSFVITSKCLVPLPEKHKGLVDPEVRVRQRYVDLIVNPEARRMLQMRSELERSIREFLWDRRFLEVETPMLQTVHGGANARPFVTDINAYDMRLYLRIAPELYLKRLLVGGVDRVFELNRNFRNEGADSTHNPEFTSLEMYAAYGDYDTMRVLTRDLILNAAVAIHGRPVALRHTGSDVAGGDGIGVEEVDLSGEWPVVTVHDAVSEAVGQIVTSATTHEDLIGICARVGVAVTPGASVGALVMELYEELVEPVTTMPTFYRDFPTATSPLTRRKLSDPQVAERWDLVAWGAEIATAYTELTDPLDQRERLTQQSLLAAAGDPEAMELDEDFLRALEFGMPPAGGQGMGIDRLLMMLVGKNIRETILFPLTKPEL